MLLLPQYHYSYLHGGVIYPPDFCRKTICSISCFIPTTFHEIFSDLEIVRYSEKWVEKLNDFFSWWSAWARLCVCDMLFKWLLYRKKKNTRHWEIKEEKVHSMFGQAWRRLWVDFFSSKKTNGFRLLLFFCPRKSVKTDEMNEEEAEGCTLACLQNYIQS